MTGARRSGPSETPITAGGHALDSDQRLFRRYIDHDDLRARNELVKRHMPLARTLASRYGGYGGSREPLDDLDQVAYVALIKAMSRYEPGQGAFRSFAVPTILGELKRHFRDHGWGVHVPRGLQENHFAVRAAIDRLTATTGREPSLQLVAAESGLNLDDAAEALDVGHASTPASLDAPAPLSGESDGPMSFIDTLGETDGGYERAERRQAALPALHQLRGRERRIVLLRFAKELSQGEIGERLGVSQMHVSRLLKISLNDLHTAAA